jgi:thiol-disulfide isomerase/thioredoxin
MKYALLFILFSLFSCKNEKSDIEKSNPVVAETITKTSPDIVLDVFDFNQLEPLLNKNDDKTYVINFWATWCAPCVKELPYYEKLQEVYAIENVEVILVSLDFPKQFDSKLKPFIKDKNIRSRVIALNDMDSNRWIPLVSEEWTGAIPATLIYNKDKKQFYEQSFEYEELETEVKQFLK